MEGFLELRLPPALRRLITRLIAIAPAIGVTLLAGEEQTARLLVLSQWRSARRCPSPSCRW